MEIRYVASGQRCQIYVSCKETLLHIYGLLNLLSWTLSHFFQWRLKVVSRCLTCLALLLSSKQSLEFSSQLRVFLLRFYYIPNPHGSPAKFSDHPLPPAAKVKPPARFALGPAGAQTQCSPLLWTTEQQSSYFLLFLKMSKRGDSWCTESSFSSLLVKLSQVFKSTLLDSILKLVVVPVACAPFY